MKVKVKGLIVIRWTAQLTAKFTTCVVISCVLFEALAKTCVPHVSEPISHVGLVHASLRFSRLCMRVFHMSHYEVNELGPDSTQRAN